MKPTLSIGNDGSYEFKNSHGVTHHIFKRPVTDRWGTRFVWLYTLTSSDPDYVQTGKLVHGIPNHLKNIIFELQKIK